MNNNKFFKFGVIALSIVLIACTGGSEAGCPELGDRNLNVVATTPMMGEFVDQVAGDNVNLTVLMPPEADPHTYEPAPQDAGTIADADLVFYTGLKYEPAAVVKLLENSACSQNILAEIGENVFPIEFKEGGHDDHDDHAGHEGHHHGEHDPHIWLDPMNAKVILNEMAEHLIENDAKNASKYKSNLKKALKDIDKLVSDVSSELNQSVASIVFHDAYQYFEKRFGVIPAGALTLNPDVLPGAKQIADIQDVINDKGIKCIFSEPQYNPKIIETLGNDMNISTGVMDPLGANIDAGPTMYSDLINGIANSIKDCH